MDRMVEFVNYVHNRLEKDWDLAIVIDGEEGVGKSTIALWLKAIYENNILSARNIVFDSADVFNLMQNAPNKSAIILDEAILQAFKRDSLEEVNKNLAKAFSIIRERNLFFMSCIPDYNDLDRHLRKRNKWRWYVDDRGHVEVYFIKKSKWNPEPWLEYRFETTFPPLPNEFYSYYKELKHKNIMEKLEEYEGGAIAASIPLTARRKLERVFAAEPKINNERASKKAGCSEKWAKIVRKDWNSRNGITIEDVEIDSQSRLTKGRRGAVDAR